MTRTPLLAVLALILTFAVVAPDAEARPRPKSGKRFESNKTLGLGLEIGTPFGLTGKYFLGPDTALQFGIGTIYHWRDRDGVNAYLDFLWHPVSLASIPAFELPLYFGIGGRLWIVDDYRFRDNRYDDGVYGLGVHVPVGVAFDFNNIPLDAFAQVAF